ncbi:hypothetical protein ABZP36_012001 [Zizania latifolia]
MAEELLMSDSTIKVFGALRMSVKMLLMWNSRMLIDILQKAPKLNCEDVISPVKIIHPPEDCNLNSSLSFTLQRKCVDDEQLLERKKVQLEDAKKTSVDNNCGTLSDTSELEKVLVDIEEKELVLQKTNVRLTKALQDEHDRRACYKDFIDHGIELAKEKLHAAEQVCFDCGC